MNLHVIKLEGGKDIVYFPNSMRFFKTNNKVVAVLREIEEGKNFQSIVDTFSEFPSSTYHHLRNLLSENCIDNELPLNLDILPRLAINISNTCNLNCRYCYAGGGSYSSTNSLMSMHTLKKVLDTFFGLYQYIEMIQLFGGEPSLNLDAIEYVGNYIKLHNYKTQLSIVTNGTIMNERLLGLINNFNIKVTISIDSYKIHNQMRPFKNGQDSYEKIKANVHTLINNSNQLAQFEITYTRQHEIQNITILDIIREIEDEFGDIPVHIAPVCTNDVKYQLVNAASYSNSIHDIFTNKKENYKFAMLQSLLLSLKYKQKMKRICGAGAGTLAVSSIGDIYPCFYFIGNKNLKIININMPKDVIKNELDKTRLKFLRLGRLNTCSNCYAEGVCHGCMGTNLYETGNIKKMSQVNCSIIKKMLDATLIELSSKINEG